MSSDLPLGWARAQLGDIVTVRGEKIRPDRSNGLPFIGMDDVLPGSLKVNSHGWFREMRSTANAVERGDILYGRLRPYLNKVAIADIRAAASAEFIVLIARAGIDARYVQFALHAKHFVNFATQDTSGDRPRIDFDKISKFEIPVPPTAEQRRIVARIDELLAEIDEGEAALGRARQALDTWRRALLKAAVTGEITRDWREANRPTETGADLLARIRAERGASCRDRSRGRRGTAVEPVDISVLRRLPEGWVWARLHELGDVTGGLTKNPDRGGFPNKLPYLRVANVQMGRLDLTEVTQIGIRSAEKSRLLLEDNDLLIVEGNGSVDQIGRCALWSGEIQPCVHQNHIIKVRFSEPILSSWALRWLLSPSGREAIETVASSTSGLHTLSISKIQNLPIPVPPREEACIALTVVEEQLAAASDAESDSKKLTGDRIALRRAILKAAFEGDWFRRTRTMSRHPCCSTA